MLDITTTSKNYAVVFRQMRTYDDRVIDAAEIGIARGLEQAVSISQNQYLNATRLMKGEQGPKRGLSELTGRLRRSIVQKTSRTSEGVVGRIGTNVPYGRYHELGFHGTINIPAHQRLPGRQFQMGNLTIGERTAERLGLLTKRGKLRKRANAVEVDDSRLVASDVRAHQRTVNYAGRPFLRPAVKEALPLVLKAIREELEKGKSG